MATSCSQDSISCSASHSAVYSEISDSKAETTRSTATATASSGAAAAGSSSSPGRGKKAQSSANVKLDRIEAGINQIISLLVGQETIAPTNPKAISLQTVNSSKTPSSLDCAGTSTNWRRLSEELQETIDALTARLETQAAQLADVQDESRRQREAAETERQDLRRRLASFRRQLDANQTARARLSAELTKAEAELAQLKESTTETTINSDMEETVEALTVQLDRSNEQLEVALLTRSCSCDQRLHDCCRSEGRLDSQDRLKRSCDNFGASGGAASEPGASGAAERKSKVRSSAKPTSRREPRSSSSKQKDIGEAARQSGKE